MNEPTDEELLARAREAAAHAYCPYSRFPVGAAVEAEDGTVYTGVNVENASYGLTVCAERVAVFRAAAAGARRLRRVAVACLQGDPDQPGTLMPCGACRQVLREFGGDETVVLVDRVGRFRLDELLPRAFHL